MQIATISVNNSWTKLSEIIASDIDEAFDFIEGEDYNIQNLGNYPAMFVESSTLPTTSNSLRATNAIVGIAARK